ncbi:hypothetical protein MAPG_02885 [Magnaporthiopsis poae ATCC 64411]|uniref:NADH-ubiquinone oxidoreductase 21.3 kDa subunit n=1 Tax=Magnaporthiopsis poae (strain ATCC 64411 / 73-15) TaxID=644358 RepID=A0A0C4DSK3_MAGP6|nr:hypothetical protein MAPG_02885 [Magnaporthiopsis poae ATCC 64411]
MASKAAAAAAGGVMSITTKQTLQSTGMWERLRRALAIDPNRSNGVPLNPHYRNPAPGDLDPTKYDDPVTVPAQVRNVYPTKSITILSALIEKSSGFHGFVPPSNHPSPRWAIAGAAGLAAFIEKNGKTAALDVLVNGLPPTPAGENAVSGKWDVHKYGLAEQSYTADYPCRSFK